MKTNLPFVRPSACALAAAALLQTAAFAAPIDAADTLPITVVTAGRFQESAASQTQGVSVITAEDIKKRVLAPSRKRLSAFWACPSSWTCLAQAAVASICAAMAKLLGATKSSWSMVCA